MNKQEFLTNIDSFYKEAFSIVEKKNSDYGATTDPFKNFNMSLMVGVEPARAILVRMSDKLARAGNVLGKESAVKETIKDTLIDLANYSAILNAYLEQ